MDDAPHRHHHTSHPAGHDGHRRPASGQPSLNAIAFRATVHCLSGCAVGEVLGMVIGTAVGLSNGATIALAVALAFVFGYAFTFFPLLRSGMTLRAAVRVAFAADTASIALMELVDNGMMLVIPGAMDAGLAAPLFWGALAVSLLVAGTAAFPLNRFLIQRGKGHALAHASH
ncbi:DUF4396 domain-containing protein [Ramlibacter tataouinensis]|uniref:Inorganic diphosphatase, membrane protein n=1 Tax=Ramlibacter tataouinensis (strain ATCC BAA-407 / DSM 14655 / LMG 21543 / TTB310) TaxID=365046 RepID=F5XZV3_RAMTT|nr:DUF4396 domain-containing protein [Ramlibacter tataouinensis]AEG93314.1 inorganic diphosphatase, membrane protein [Ramlibacter tataouinensis TTB310]